MKKNFLHQISFFFVFLTLMTLASCAHGPGRDPGPFFSFNGAPPVGPDGVPLKEYSIPITMNEDIQRWIDYFTKRDAERFQRYLERGNSYKDVVQSILKENELPLELYYLALIESGYSTHARSRAKAVGAWQFIKATAKRYDLLVDPFVDERRDPIRATEAAGRYLENLYTRFNSWELALAAYNCGENRVARAIREGNTNDYWDLVAMRLLPSETRNYVPKFMAAILIGENPEYYGLKPPSEENIYPSIQTVEVPSPIKLASLAEVTSIPLEELKAVNPHLLKDMTPPAANTYEVWIPEEKLSVVKEKLPILVQHVMTKKDYIKFAGLGRGYSEEGSKKYYKSVRERRGGGQNIYVVKRGDTLEKIGKRYGLSVTYLKNLNDLNHSRLQVGQRIYVSSRGYQRGSADKKGIYYYVRSGDTLSDVAGKFGLSLQTLKELNHLTSSKIYRGQKLRVKPFQNARETVFHIVKRGDTLSSISKKYKVKTKKLRRINDMKKSSDLQIGQKIRVR